jgi:hypothetical protein
MPERERALGIGIDNQATMTGLVREGSELSGQGAFTRPTLSGRHRDDVHA